MDNRCSQKLIICLLATFTILASPVLSDDSMPIGGLGTGAVWLGGDGAFRSWQIAGDSAQPPPPDTFLGLWVRGNASYTRILQYRDGEGLVGFPDVTCTLEYPFVRIAFEDKNLPVGITLEGFNPMIPLQVRDSALPCAVFRLTAKNKSDAPLAASFLFSLQNPLGALGTGEALPRVSAAFGGNQNAWADGRLSLSLPSTDAPAMGRPIKLFARAPFSRAVHHCRHVSVVDFPVNGLPDVDAVWLSEDALEGDPRIWFLLQRAAEAGQPILLAGIKPEAFKSILKTDGAAAINASISSPWSDVPVKWPVTKAMAVSRELLGPSKVLVAHEGRPLVVSCSFGKTTMFLALAPNLPPAWGMKWLAEALDTTYHYGEGLPSESPCQGNIALSAVGGEPTACTRWTDRASLLRDFSDDGRLSGPADVQISPMGQTFNSALSVPFALKGGETKSIAFVLSWHFPNDPRASLMDKSMDAAAVNGYVRKAFNRLWTGTKSYHDTLLETNLPYPMLAMLRSQSMAWRSDPFGMHNDGAVARLFPAVPPVGLNGFEVMGRLTDAWTWLLSAQGIVYQEDQGHLGFTPQYQPEDHASFFSCSAGWGLFTQQGAADRQVSTIQCRGGKIVVKELLLSCAGRWRPPDVSFNGQVLPNRGTAQGNALLINIGKVILKQGDTLTVTIPRQELVQQ